VDIADRAFILQLRSFEKFVYGLVGFSLINNTPIVWQTNDAIFLYSLGLVLALRQRTRLVGYCIIGLAPLARQNLIFMLPATIILLKDARKIRAWAALFMPSIGYGIYVIINGAWPDMIIQILAQESIFKLWNKSVFINPLTIGGVAAGYIVILLKSGKLNFAERINDLLAGIIVFCIIVTPVLSLLVSYDFIYRASYFFFGAVAGLVLGLVTSGKKFRQYVPMGIIALLLGWSVSISLGNPTPFFAFSALLSIVIAYERIINKRLFQPGQLSKWRIVQGSILIVLSVLCSWVNKTRHIFRENPVPELKYSLDGVLPGARSIRTNPNNYKLLVDLKKAIAATGGRTYAIVESFQGYWVKSPQPNPLPIDLTINPELPTQVFVDRVVNYLNSNRGQIIVIVPKASSVQTSQGLFAMSTLEYSNGWVRSDLMYRYSEVARYVIRNFSWFAETDYFILYK